MGLYKLMEGAKYPYWQATDFEISHTLQRPLYNDFLLARGGNYVQTMDPWFVWTSGSKYGNLGQLTYGLGMMRATTYWPSWDIAWCCWESHTGNLVWFDYGVAGMDLITFAHIRAVFQDTEGRIWIHDVYGRTYRVKERPYEVDIQGNEATGALSPGMPIFGFYENGIGGDHWVEEDGVTQASHHLICNVRGIDHINDVAFLGYDTTAAYNNTRTINIHRVSDGVRTGIIAIPDDVLRVSIIDGNTAYVFGTGSSIMLIDYKTNKFLGVNYFDSGKIGPINYDPINKRIISFFDEPDDPDGKCNSKLEAWANKPIGGYLQKPMPIKKPRVGSTVPVISRLVGGRGEPIAGATVTATLTGPNTIKPNAVKTDTNGWAKFYYTLNTEGVDIDNLVLSTEFETGIEADAGIILDQPTLPRPLNVAQEDFFHPGHWIHTTSNKYSIYPHLKWGHIAETEEHGIVGIVQELTWGAIEKEYAGDTDYSTVDRDIAFCQEHGLKYMVAFQLAYPTASNSQGRFPFLVPRDVAGAFVGTAPIFLDGHLLCWHHDLCQIPPPEEKHFHIWGTEATASHDTKYIPIENTQQDKTLYRDLYTSAIVNLCGHLSQYPEFIGVMPVGQKFLNSSSDMSIRRPWFVHPLTGEIIYDDPPSYADWNTHYDYIIDAVKASIGDRLCWYRVNGEGYPYATINNAIDRGLNVMIDRPANPYVQHGVASMGKEICTGITLAAHSLEVSTVDYYAGGFAPTALQRGEQPWKWDCYKSTTGGSQSRTARQWLLGGTYPFPFEDAEYVRGIEEDYSFWFFMWPDDPWLWQGEDGIAAVSYEHQLTRARQYYGS